MRTLRRKYVRTYVRTHLVEDPLVVGLFDLDGHILALRLEERLERVPLGARRGLVRGLEKEAI